MRWIWFGVSIAGWASCFAYAWLGVLAAVDWRWYVLILFLLASMVGTFWAEEMEAKGARDGRGE